MTQKEKILEFLSRRTSSGKPFVLTPMKAFSKLYITKLSTRISELIDEGYPIRKVPVKKYDKKGKLLTHYMSYYLEEKNEKAASDSNLHGIYKADREAV